jgi:hypothetical protein
MEILVVAVGLEVGRLALYISYPGSNELDSILIGLLVRFACGTRI